LRKNYYFGLGIEGGDDEERKRWREGVAQREKVMLLNLGFYFLFWGKLGVRG